MHRQKYHYTLLNAVTLLHKIIVTPSFQMFAWWQSYHETVAETSGRVIHIVTNFSLLSSLNAFAGTCNASSSC